MAVKFTPWDLRQRTAYGSNSSSVDSGSGGPFSPRHEAVLKLHAIFSRLREGPLVPKSKGALPITALDGEIPPEQQYNVAACYIFKVPPSQTLIEGNS